MNGALEHRGPDEGGLAFLGFAALAMRRLAVVDVAHGAQPMTTDDGRHVLVYNGELYDTDALCRELAADGIRTRTRSDTEVLLRLLARDGLAALERVNGMFACAFADRDERTLLLARDPIGIKPLYYFHAPGGELVFSSELTSLIEHPLVPRRLDRASLAGLLVDRHVAGPHTLYEGVLELPPGHWLRWRDGALELGAFASPRLAPRHWNEDDAVAELEARLAASVRSQLVADVPVGVLLSGGIDSSTVAAYAAEARAEAGQPLDTFSVGFADPEYDESAAAREVAAHLGTRHHEVRIEDARFDPQLFDDVLDHVGQPLGDTSCIPTLAVARLAREHVTVALSGDGGDELFGGYDHMFWVARGQLLVWGAPRPLRRLGAAVLSGVAPVAPAAVATRARRAQKGLALSLLEPGEHLRRLRSLWSPEETAALLDGDVALRPGCDLAAPELAGLATEERAMQVLMNTYLPGAILRKVDRMSMAASLEVRVPLLDARVVEHALSLPLSLKIRADCGKYVLRRAGRDRLPASVYQRKKRGFSIPLCDWFNESFWEMTEDLLAPGSAAGSLFRPAALEAALAAGRSARRREHALSHRAAANRVWVLAQVARWIERFGVSVA